MVSEEQTQTPQNPKLHPPISANGGTKDAIFSPRFRSAAAMAGWDEEALMLASLVVEDTPERESKHKKRISVQFKTPPTHSRRKRRAQRASPPSIPSVVLNLDDEETPTKESGKKKVGLKANATEEKKKTGEESKDASSLPKQNSVKKEKMVLPCMDRLREELSCAICLEICFEPSTTPCGHSFCKKCLKSAADKCGKKCPKCRQLIGNGRSCTVNTILWNTIQLLFPKEVEARKAAAEAINSRETARESPSKHVNNVRSRSTGPFEIISGSRRNTGPFEIISGDVSARRRGGTLPSQDEDAALALRLQRQEFMGVYSGTNEQSRTTHISSSRANLRAMAERAMNLRIRNRLT